MKQKPTFEFKNEEAEEIVKGKQATMRGEKEGREVGFQQKIVKAPAPNGEAYIVTLEIEIDEETATIPIPLHVYLGMNNHLVDRLEEEEELPIRKNQVERRP